MLVDIIVLLILVMALVSGLRSGFFSSLGSMGGLLVGGAAAYWVVPQVARAVDDPQWRWIAGFALTVLLLLLGSRIGSSLGRWISRGTDRIKLRVPERLLGGALTTIVAALVLSIAAPAVMAAGIPNVSSAVSSSTAVQAIDRLLPDRLQQAGDDIRASLADTPVLPSLRGPGVPAAPPGQPTQDAPPQDIDPDSPELAAASQSVARVSGIAAACQVMPTGSGFVVAENRIVTNAHVVAGVDAPVVTLPDGQAADGRVVYFNEADDIAVIQAPVDAAPLDLADGVAEGEAGVVQGYPGGGPFRSVPASVARTGPTQFANDPQTRTVHQLAAEVEPGNSGGPFLTAAGEVGGVVFGRDEAHGSTAYAMTVDAVHRAAGSFADSASPVPTGECVAA